MTFPTLLAVMAALAAATHQPVTVDVGATVDGKALIQYERGPSTTSVLIDPHDGSAISGGFVWASGIRLYPWAARYVDLGIYQRITAQALLSGAASEPYIGTGARIGRATISAILLTGPSSIWTVGVSICLGRFLED